MIAELGLYTSVYSPNSLGFSSQWFEHNANIRKDHGLNKNTTFMVIPEVWAGRFGYELYNQGFKYAIYVQNAYYLDAALKWGHSSEQVKQVYENAELILSISRDTSAMVSMIYPGLDKKKIINILPHVSDEFAPGRKEKIISYMPRKLPTHSKRMAFFIKEYLPEDWKLVPIEKMSAPETAAIMAKSSIFLSFSDIEGIGLPPLEAALSGAVVVGYTGQGGREYFKKPNFALVQNGDFRTFTLAISDAIKTVDKGLLESKEFEAGRVALAKKYSRDKERARLADFVSRVPMSE
ncbi:hypothetical protein GN278_12205 [Rhodobacteraceae bacterium Araon29]